MQIEQKPVCNFWPGDFTKIAIVDHCMGRDKSGNLGTIEGTYSWFNNPDSEVSSNFGVARDGRVWQFVASNEAAWCNGIVEKPDLTIAWLSLAMVRGVNPNKLTISIEHEGDGVLPMPEAQFQATLVLHRLLLSDFNIPADTQHIIRHSQITGIQKANCPGVSFPMARLLKELNKVDKTFTDPVTSFQVKEPFASFYLANGGLRIFGRPVRNEEPVAWYYGNSNLIQWFERARFELQPDGSVLLGLVGNEALKFLSKSR